MSELSVRHKMLKRDVTNSDITAQETSPCSVSHVSYKRDTACICCRPTAGNTRAATVDQYFLPAGCSAANPPHAAVEQRDRQTEMDGRTLDRFIDSAPHTM